MKKVLILIGIIFIFSSIPTQAQETQTPANTTSNIVTFSQNEKWGAKDSQGNILIQPIYKKMIRLGDNSWIVQNKKTNSDLLVTQGKNLYLLNTYMQIELFQNLQNSEIPMTMEYMTNMEM